MSAGHELFESLERIPALQRQVTKKGQTLHEQARWLEAEVDELARRNREKWKKAQKLEAISKLSLLSEVYAVISFDKMVEARETFQRLFPEHFKEYMKHLSSSAWQASWPGCLECRYYGLSDGKCSLSLVPVEGSVGRHDFKAHCSSKEIRTSAA